MRFSFKGIHDSSSGLELNRSMILRTGIIAFCAIAVIVTALGWQGGSLFGGEFSWQDRSFALEQSFNSASRPIEKDSDSSNPVTEEDQKEIDVSNSGAPAAGNAIGTTPVANTSAPKIKEVPKGDDGNLPGGNGVEEVPSPGNGEGDGSSGGDDEGSSGGEGGGANKPVRDDPEIADFDRTEYEPGSSEDKVINPDRFTDYGNNPAIGDSATNKPDVLMSHNIWIKDGNSHIPLKKDAEIDFSKDVEPYLDSEYMLALHGDTNNVVKRKGLTLGIGKETPTRLGYYRLNVSFTSPNPGGFELIDCMVYDYKIWVEDCLTGKQMPGIFFNEGDFGESTYRFSDQDWAPFVKSAQPNDGSLMRSIFPGFYLDASPDAKDAIGWEHDLDASVKQPLIYAHEPVSVQSGVQIRRQGADQVFVGLSDDSSVAGGSLHIDPGVTKLVPAFSPATNTVTKLIVPNTVKDIDIKAIFDAFPNLEDIEIEAGNIAYEIKDSCLLARQSDGASEQKMILAAIIRTPSVLAEGVTIPSEVTEIAESAFDAFRGQTEDGIDKHLGLRIKFESPSAPSIKWENIPDGAEIIPPRGDSSKEDVPWCSYLLSIKQREAEIGHAIGAILKEPQGGLVRYGPNYMADIDKSRVIFELGSDDFALAYIGQTGSFEYRVDGVVEILPGAASQLNETSSLVLSSDVRRLGSDALTDLGPIETIMVEDPGHMDFYSSPVFGRDASANFKVVLRCEIGSEDYSFWLSELKKTFGGSAASHIVAVGSEDSTSLLTDPITGSVYKKDANANTLELLGAASTIKRYEFESVSENGRIESIAQGAFANCKDLVVANIPDTVKKVGDDAFEGCSALEAVIVPNAALEGSDISDWKSRVGISSTTSSSSEPVRVFISEDHRYDGDSCVYERLGDQKLDLVFVSSDCPDAITLLDGTCFVSDRVFANHANVESLAGTSGISTIGQRAFENCENLRYIEPFGSLISIGDEAFIGCGIEGSLKIVGNNLRIGDRAFANCAGIWDLTIEGSVNSIGNRAFERCMAIDNVVLGASDGHIAETGKLAFAETKIKSLTLKGSVDSISYGSFANCSSLRTLTAEGDATSALKRIEDYAFFKCTELYTAESTRLMNYSSLESIGKYAFAGTSKWLELVIPKNLKTIGDHAFSSVGGDAAVGVASASSRSNDSKSGLRYISTPYPSSCLRSIGAQAFSDCPDLVTVLLDDVGADLVIGDRAFADSSRLTRVAMPNSLVSLGSATFENCSGLSTFGFAKASDPCKLSFMGVAVFKGCSLLKTASFANTNLTELPTETFSGCDGLMFVSLPKAIESIESEAFFIKSESFMLQVEREDPPHIAPDAFDKTYVGGYKVRVPGGKDIDSVPAYRENEEWIEALGLAIECIANIESGTIEANGAIYEIADGGGYRLISLNPSEKGQGFTPMEGTIEIAAGAFKDCEQLLAVVVPSTIKTLNQDVFEGCSNLESIVFEGETIDNISTRLFGRNMDPPIGLKVYIVNGSKSFYGTRVALKDLEMVVGGESYECDDSSGTLYTSYSSPSAKMLIKVPQGYNGALVVDSNTTYVAKRAAFQCTGLQRVEFSTKVKRIDAEAFSGCSSMTLCRIANTQSQQLGEIGEKAFYGCTSLQWFSGQNGNTRLPISLTKIGDSAFENCTSLASLSIYGPVKELPKRMLAGCTSLTSLTGSSSTFMPALTTIGTECFEGCTSITYQGLSLASFEALTTIGDRAFAGCENASLAVFPQSLKKVGNGAFSGCPSIEVIAFNGSAVLQVQGTGLEASMQSARVFVPESKKASFESAWASIVPAANIKGVSETYRAVGGSLYAQMTGGSLSGTLKLLASTNATLEAQKPVGSYVGYTYGNNAALRTTEMADDALSNMRALRSFSSTAHMEVIGDRALSNCKNLTQVDLSSGSDNRLTIGNYAFSGSSNIKEISLRGQTTLGARAFAGMSDNFTIDATRCVVAPDLRESGGESRLFGETIPQGTRIITSDSNRIEIANAWGRVFKREYGLDMKAMLELFPGTVEADLGMIFNERDRQEVDEADEDGIIEDDNVPTDDINAIPSSDDLGDQEGETIDGEDLSEESDGDIDEEEESAGDSTDEEGDSGKGDHADSEGSKDANGALSDVDGENALKRSDLNRASA